MFELKKNFPGLSYITANSKINPSSSAIDLTGESTFSAPPEELTSYVAEALRVGDISYDVDGYMPFRELISDLYFNNYSYRYNPETEITISSGYNQAYATIISGLIKESDEVIIFEPAHYTYLPIIEANGGRPVYIQLKQPDFHINWDEVQKVITARTKMIIINTPHHVTGAILTASDMERLSKIVNGTNIMILSDETNGSVIFEGYEHQSIARYPKLAERSFIVSGFSKILNIDSWKISFCIAPEKLMNSFRRMQHFQIFSANLPFQVALNNYFRQNKATEVGTEYQRKRDILLKDLKNSKLSFLPSSGSNFQVFNYSKLSSLKDIAYCQQILEQNNIKVTPLSLFYHDTIDLRFFRVSFAKPDELLARANEILLNLS
jgi:methionine aminotransferase